MLVAPPNVPPAIDRNKPARVIVELETTEQKGILANGVEYTFWTFGGTVPGPIMRVRQGDLVEIRLTNRKDSHLMHSIDLHAVTGPGGESPSECLHSDHWSASLPCHGCAGDRRPCEWRTAIDDCQVVGLPLTFRDDPGAQ